MTESQPTDTELLEAWRAGDAQAGDMLLRRHFVGLRSFFLSRVNDEDAAKDLVQDTMLTAVKNRDDFRGESTFGAYLFGIARNLAWKRIQQRAVDRRRFDPASDSVADMTGRRHSSVLGEKDEIRRLFDALRNIPWKAQELLELHYFQDLTAEELAALEKINPNTMKSRLRLARQKLGRKLQELAGAAPGRELDDEQIHARMMDARASARRGELRPPDTD